MEWYADSSVLVKRHVDEPGSARFLSIADPEQGNTIITAQISLIEVVSALRRRVREGLLAEADADQIEADVQSLCAYEYQVIALSDAVVQFACQLLARHPLRAYDAGQLAAALLANQALLDSGLPPLTFLSADRRLLQAAVAEGLAVENLS
jgi:uncharacterized protein